MFENLSERFGEFFRKVSGRGTITEANVREAMADVRTALLEADVHQDVVASFSEDVLRESVGRDVTKSLKPGQEMIGIIHDRLVTLMGGDPAHPDQRTEPIEFVAPGPTVIMMCGLQGSGKTTTCGKIAAWCRRRGLNVLVAAADLQRPAAVEQLRQVVDTVKAEAPGGSRVEFYGEPDKCAEYGKAVGVAISVCQRAWKTARDGRYDVLLLDTAGRLHINDDLMKELQGVKSAVQPHQILLVVDSMTGQDALRSAKAFHERLHVDGLILTKFDSESRGGAALSAKFVTGAPVRFVGTGEKWDALEEFHPERVAGRILGMGDVVSLVEKAKQEVSEEEAEKLANKMAAGRLTVDDFISQMKSIRRMGPLKSLMAMLPGVGAALKNVNIDDKQIDHIEAIGASMTQAERDNVKIVSKSRSRRICSGSGTKEHEVNRFVDSFLQMQKLTQQMASGGLSANLKAAKEMAKSGALPGMGSMPGVNTKGSSATVSPKAKFKKRK
ncbi:MAG: signal recognition particle protein [Phycisphaerae bacterium]|nr:signal recognition particle protein [Phycisphaerae bacterium]